MSNPRATQVFGRLALGAALLVHLTALYLPRVPEGIQVQTQGADKVVHVAVFAAVLLTGAWSGIPARWSVPVLIAHAFLSEVIQHLALPGRSGEWGDVAANLGGVALGAYLVTVVRRRRLNDGGPGPSAASRSDPPPSARR